MPDKNRINLRVEDELRQMLEEKAETVQFIREWDDIAALSAMIKHGAEMYWVNRANFVHCPDCDAVTAPKDLINVGSSKPDVYTDINLTCKSCGCRFKYLETSTEDQVIKL